MAMKAYGQAIRLRPESRERYLQLHQAAWPGVLQKIAECNIRNYRIFLCGDLLFAYFEYVGTNFEADMQMMADDPLTQAWWRETDPLQERLPGTPDGEQWLTLPEVFFSGTK
jgi:L-rhamnose mutarotase